MVLVFQIDHQCDKWYLALMAGRKPPKNESAPQCACGCGESVNWIPGRGWAQWRKGHARRGKPTFAGRKHTSESRRKISEAVRRRYVGKRRRDSEETPGQGVYCSWEYQEARKSIIQQPCSQCGATENIHAHHEVPGDDSTLVPLCRKCHPKMHGRLGKPRLAPEGSVPKCACGCGQDVAWCSGRGWSKYRSGHSLLKISGAERYRDAPICACGCGESTTYKSGVGWHEYKRGHRNRVRLRPGSRLSDADVLRIRQMASKGILQREIAEQFGVARSYVSQIVSGARRKHRCLD